MKKFEYHNFYIEHLANDAFLIKSCSHSILVDAFFS